MVAADLDLLDRCVAIEAWWWTCDMAADFGLPAWRDRAAGRAARLARDAGEYGEGLLREAHGGSPGRQRRSIVVGACWQREPPPTMRGPVAPRRGHGLLGRVPHAAGPDASSARRNGA